MPKVNKTEQSIYECLLGFCLTTLRCHKFWLHRQFSSAQFQKRKNDKVISLCYLLLVCFEQ